jgi:hypothetical protein
VPTPTQRPDIVRAAASAGGQKAQNIPGKLWQF